MIEYIEKTRDDGTVEQLSKLQAVQEEMQPFFTELLAKKDDDKKKKKEWHIRIYNKLESVLLKLERPMANSDALNMTADELYKAYNEYCDLCCWIGEQVGISYYKSKPEFCSYCGITTTAFAKFSTDGDYHQREAADDIDTRIANSIQMAAENSEIKSTASEFRMTAKHGIGHKIQTTTAREPVAVIPVTANSFTPVNELMSGVAVIPTKQLGSGRK